MSAGLKLLNVNSIKYYLVLATVPCRTPRLAVLYTISMQCCLTDVLLAIEFHFGAGTIFHGSWSE
jgi:hypothetical protein